MNERIRLLIEQATSTQGPTPYNPLTFEVFDKEKFAQLIVQECMACSTWVGKVNKNAIEPIHTAHAINQRIKKHFGVEE